MYLLCSPLLGSNNRNGPPYCQAERPQRFRQYAYLLRVSCGTRRSAARQLWRRACCAHLVHPEHHRPGAAVQQWRRPQPAVNRQQSLPHLPNYLLNGCDLGSSFPAIEPANRLE